MVTSVMNLNDYADWVAMLLTLLFFSQVFSYFAYEGFGDDVSSDGSVLERWETGLSFSFFTKCQSGDIKFYGGAPNFSIHPHIG